MVASPSLLMTSYLRERGVVGVTWHIWEFYTPWNISAAATARDCKFCIWVGHVMTDYPPNGRGQVTWPVSAFLAQAIFLEWMKLDISNLVCRLNVKCTKSKEFCSLGVHSESRDLLKFSEISANISETVQHRDIVTHAHAHTHTHPFNGPFSGTTRVSRYQKGKTLSGFYCSKRQWVAVASAGPYASLHLAADR